MDLSNVLIAAIDGEACPCDGCPLKLRCKHGWACTEYWWYLAPSYQPPKKFAMQLVGPRNPKRRIYEECFDDSTGAERD